MENDIRPMIDKEELIELVKKRPVIWDQTLNSYKYRNTRHDAWIEICGILLKDFHKMKAVDRRELVLDLQKKWKHLKDYYVREKRKGSNLFTTKSNPHFRMLTFLNKQRSQHSKNTKAKKRSSIDISSETLLNNMYVSPHNNSVSVQNTVSNCCKLDDLDPDKNFLLCLLPDMKSMSEKEKFEFKYEVMSTMKRIKYDSRPTTIYISESGPSSSKALKLKSKETTYKIEPSDDEFCVEESENSDDE